MFSWCEETLNSPQWLLCGADQHCLQVTAHISLRLCTYTAMIFIFTLNPDYLTVCTSVTDLKGKCMESLTCFTVKTFNKTGAEVPIVSD